MDSTDKMKYTINGFSQSKLIEYGLDSVDALILRYFIDFKDSGDMVIEIVNNKPYYWVKYDKLIQAIPIINMKSKDALRRRLKKLENCKVLEHYHKNQGGSYSFYGIGENYKFLVRNIDPSIEDSEDTPEKLEDTTEKSEGTTEKSEGYDSKVGGATTEKSEQNINLLKDNSIKDNIYTKNFLQWYSLYPNPWNKEQTFKNFNKLLKAESFENLMAATKNYIAYLRQQGNVDKQYITRSTNFIGQKKEYLGYLEMDIQELKSNTSQIKSSLETIENWGN
ncbi:hypothetical protein ACJDU8_12835 [Clostridium sp. WILCCON 0269]|uniref:Uncharacterized protein n=1 Tax=Candidatus Clostridium eludens TaxID=3381663 RepID=A0ABW8SMP3_9CLOT